MVVGHIIPQYQLYQLEVAKYPTLELHVCILQGFLHPPQLLPLLSIVVYQPNVMRETENQRVTFVATNMPIISEGMQI
jgi:hypothetical protein